VQVTRDQSLVNQLIEAGQLTPSLDRTYPLERAADGMRRMEKGEIRGKVALTL